MTETNIDNEWSLYKKHIEPTFGHRKITSIRPLEIQRWLTKKEQHYAASYVVRMYMIMNKVFKQAQAWELIKNNPIKGVNRP